MTDIEGESVDQLQAEHRPMARRLARRYSHGTTVDPDLAQVAELGLFLAARRYDPAAGPFRPFAMATIIGELKKHLRAHGWAVRVPRRLQEASITVGHVVETLEQELGRSPTPTEIAARTDMSEELVLRALQARNARFWAEPPTRDAMPADNTSTALDDVLDVRQAAAGLPAESRELLQLRFEAELTQREIAERLQISQTQVHRRLGAVLDRLRAEIEPDPEGGT